MHCDEQESCWCGPCEKEWEEQCELNQKRLEEYHKSVEERRRQRADPNYVPSLMEKLMPRVVEGVLFGVPVLFVLWVTGLGPRWLRWVGSWMC